VPRVHVTITNTNSRASTAVLTGDDGRYVAGGLPPGSYWVKAETPGFRNALRTNIILTAGACERIDVGLTLELGICEMVAIEAVKPSLENLLRKKKPFTYVVGSAQDGGTLRGVAKVVYGNPNLWLQIFEANRDLGTPESLSYGETLEIPPKKRLVPKLIHKVEPEYPPLHKRDGLTGDVFLDVTLNEDGTVARTNVIDGDPMLAEAAFVAVREWRYRPLRVDGKLVLNFVVVVTFTKNGKVRTIK